ncbi:tetratricopeptide repeat protein [Akkermansiaceae bacterium]|nr:tetratricopeptide repeat protein [Akkermansiaceae bacterium]
MSENNTLASAPGGPLGEISQAPPALEIFLDRHQAKVIALALLLAIAAIAYVVYDGIRKSGEESAGALLSKAEDLSALQEVVKNHAGTAASYSAKILLAEKQWEDGQQDDAIATLEAFVAGDPSHPGRPSAQASLAAKLRSQGKEDEAADIFRDITEDVAARHLAPYAWISLGDIALAKGDKEAAADAYGAVEREFPENPFTQQAIQRQLLLKAAAPVPVDAPIVVPDVKITDEENDAAPGDVSPGNLLDTIQGGGLGGDSNPLLPEGEKPE